MLNTNAFLNPKLFDEDMEKVSPRVGFGEGIVLVGEADKRVVALCADLTKSLQLDVFKEKFPDRFIEVGVAEQNLITIASGLAAEGKIPFACSFAVFSPGRCWEQIRTTVCLNNQPVKIISSHAGISVGADGATHQALEDIALTRVLPNMIVLSPVDAIQTKKAILAMAKILKPCYMRLPRNETPVITSEKSPFEIGQAEIFWDPSKATGHFADVTIIATGQMVYQALLVAKQLTMDKISVRVINIHTIKPLDEKLILKAAEETGTIVTVEEHQIAGGLGSAVVEVVSEKFPVPVKILGVNDVFGQSGETKELLEKYGLTKEGIIKGIVAILKMKRR